MGMLVYENIESEKRAEKLRELASTQREIEKSKAEQVVQSVQKVQDIIATYCPGIICWGDSLTAGAGGNGTTYPSVLSSLIKKNVTDKFDINEVSDAVTDIGTITTIPVVNMGVGGENCPTILGRNGAVPFVVSEKFVVPADTSSVEIKIESQNGKEVAPLRQGNAGMEYVIIDGVQGTIYVEQESYMSPDYKYWFKREAVGEELTVEKGTEIVTEGSEAHLNYIPVIFIGTNGGYEDISELIEQQTAIIDHQKGNPDGRYIIVGLHYIRWVNQDELEQRMEEVYGRRYINLRAYMSTEAMDDAGLEPTEEDLELMEQGLTPGSLLYDRVHFNDVGYKLLGELIYKRMDELGYFEEVKNAIDDFMVKEE